MHYYLVHYACTLQHMFARMVKRCIAAGCSNTHKDGVSLFQFPRDPQLKQKWIKQVQRTRAGWSGPGSVAGSVLCSAHFEKSCFEPSCLIYITTLYYTVNAAKTFQCSNDNTCVLSTFAEVQVYITLCD